LLTAPVTPVGFAEQLADTVSVVQFVTDSDSPLAVADAVMISPETKPETGESVHDDPLVVVVPSKDPFL